MRVNKKAYHKRDKKNMSDDKLHIHKKRENKKKGGQ